MTERLCGAMASGPMPSARCVREFGHSGDCSFRMSYEEFQQACGTHGAPALLADTSLDELLEHLDDLIAMARSEGFGLLASTLAKQHAVIVAHRNVYEPTKADRAKARLEFTRAAAAERAR